MILISLSYETDADDKNERPNCGNRVQRANDSNGLQNGRNQIY